MPSPLEGYKANLTCVASGFEKATDDVVFVIVGGGKYDVIGASTSCSRMSKLLSEMLRQKIKHAKNFFQLKYNGKNY